MAPSAASSAIQAVLDGTESAPSGVSSPSDTGGGLIPDLESGPFVALMLDRFDDPAVGLDDGETQAGPVPAGHLPISKIASRFPGGIPRLAVDDHLVFARPDAGGCRDVEPDWQAVGHPSTDDGLVLESQPHPGYGVDADDPSVVVDHEHALGDVLDDGPRATGVTSPNRYRKIATPRLLPETTNVSGVMSTAIGPSM